jgi:hypothetical protein
MIHLVTNLTPKKKERIGRERSSPSREYFPIFLTETRYFERYETRLVRKALHDRRREQAEEVQRSGPRKRRQVNECLLFGGASTTGGYKKFWVNGRSVPAHFFAFFAKVGHLPRSMHWAESIW